MKDFIKKIKNNKRLLYFTTVTVIVLFCLVLNISFSAFTLSAKKEAVNITVGDFTYSITLNGVSGNIITAIQNDITKMNVGLKANNTMDTDYELIYTICTDQECTQTVSSVEGLTVEYSSRTVDEVNGEIVKKGEKNIRLVITNTTNTNYYIKLGIKAGFAYNELALINQINSEYNEEDLTIITYIDGSLSATFPSTKDYTVTSECKNAKDQSVDTSLAGTWTNNKWNISVNNLLTGETRCNLYFDEAAPLGWKTASSGTLLAGIKNNYASPTSTLTTPGKQISTSNEAVLARTSDDYGTSYYFRGNVENNYVIFADMCWRIVRIDGLGNIKLVLYNYNRNKTNITNPCASTYDGTSNAYARYSGTTYKAKFNAYYSYNAHIGFMYGTYSTSYNNEHANTNKSTILTALENWYESNGLSTYASKLADVIWCNDKYTSYSGTNTNESNYEARGRLYPATYASPTLICPNDKMGGNLSKFTVSSTIAGGNGALSQNGAKGYKIGLLTADEAAFAGAVFHASNTTNSTYYLYKNASSEWWWTLSPFRFGDDSATVLGVSTTGLVNIAVNDSNAVRPAISLVSTVTISSGGEGTASNPFVVQ